MNFDRGIWCWTGRECEAAGRVEEGTYFAKYPVLVNHFLQQSSELAVDDPIARGHSDVLPLTCRAALASPVRLRLTVSGCAVCQPPRPHGLRAHVPAGP